MSTTVNSNNINFGGDPAYGDPPTPAQALAFRLAVGIGITSSTVFTETFVPHSSNTFYYGPMTDDVEIQQPMFTPATVPAVGDIIRLAMVSDGSHSLSFDEYFLVDTNITLPLSLAETETAMVTMTRMPGSWCVTQASVCSLSTTAP